MEKERYYSISNLREIYKNNDNIKLSFIDFIFCVEDYYTIAWSTRMSRNSWLIFSWLRTLVRYDGYVKLSFSDISSKFCDKNVISKPTFFKCINELDEMGLVKKVKNIKQFDSGYQNDTNTYIVLSKLDEMLPIIENVDKHENFYAILKEKYSNIKAESKPKENTKKNTGEYKQEYEQFLKKYHKIKSEIIDFFEFLASGNKTGKIANSRKSNIINKIEEFQPSENDLSYCIQQTILKNAKSEKYLYAILRNIYQKPKAEKVDRKTKELQTKYKRTYPTKSNAGFHLDNDTINKYKKELKASENAYKYIEPELQKIREKTEAELALVKLCDEARYREKMIEVYDVKLGVKRKKFLRTLGVYELSWRDENFNMLYAWSHDKWDETDLLSYKEIKQIADKYPKYFKFGKYQYMDESMV